MVLFDIQENLFMKTSLSSFFSALLYSVILFFHSFSFGECLKEDHVRVHIVILGNGGNANEL